MLQSFLILLAVLLMVRMLRQRAADASSYAVTAESDDATPENLWDHVEHPYHCVACKCDNVGCKAVDPFRGHYYLMDDSHQLPVPECKAVPCRCHYVHYADRRQAEEDRRSIFGLESQVYRFSHDSDRRISLGRRKEDWAAMGVDEAIGQQ